MGKIKDVIVMSESNPTRDQKNSDHVTVNITLGISRQRIASLLVGAFEGGSNYWLRSIESQWDSKFGKPRPILDEGDEKPDIWKCYDYPLQAGGKVVCVDAEGDGKEYTLDLDAIHKGLAAMAQKCPRHFGDFISGGDDATTSDVFLQCCLFGEIVYG